MATIQHNTHRIAIIGLGPAALTHVESLLELYPRVQVVTAYTRSAERAESFKNRLPFQITRELERIQEDSTINCVLIATPPCSHLELVERFARARKHILLEKPIETTVERSRLIVSTCIQEGVSLGVVLQYRFRDSSLSLQRALQEDGLGRIIGADIRLPWWRPQSYYDEPGRGTLARDGGGVLLTQAIHILDLFWMISGGIDQVMAYAKTSPVHHIETEDIVAAVFRLFLGGIGTLSATTASYPGYLESIDIVAERGTARLVGHYLDIRQTDGKAHMMGAKFQGRHVSPVLANRKALRALHTEFFDAVEGGRDPSNNGHSALQVHLLIDALLESARNGGPIAVKTQIKKEQPTKKLSSPS